MFVLFEDRTKLNSLCDSWGPAQNAEALLKREVADSRTMMQIMAVGCVAVFLATGFAARWWYAPTPVVAEPRAPVLAPPVPPVAVVVGGAVTTSTSEEMPKGATATPQATGDYACAFGYASQPGLNCPEDERGVTGPNRSTKTVR